MLLLFLFISYNFFYFLFFLFFLSFFLFYLSIYLSIFLFFPITLSPRHPPSPVTPLVGQGRIWPTTAPARRLWSYSTHCQLERDLSQPCSARTSWVSSRGPRVSRHLLSHRLARSSLQLPSTPWCSPKPNHPRYALVEEGSALVTLTRGGLPSTLRLSYDQAAAPLCCPS